MEQIMPITAENIGIHRGKMVCAVLQDETRFYGYLGDIRDGKLILYEQPTGMDELTDSLETRSKRNRGKLSKKTNMAKTKALTEGVGYGYDYGGFWIDLALISLLFLVPLFFI